MRTRVFKKMLPLMALFIITLPTFYSLLKGDYFTMHDDQHIARLFLFHEAIMQGQLYPRWVGILGFGYGYPLFNFYPPLIYVVSEIFHFLGFSLINSVKLMIITGIFTGAVGMFYLMRRRTTELVAYISALLFSYFGYRAVTVYVRGAFAEFFALTTFVFVNLSWLYLWENPTLVRAIGFGITLALLIVCHPLLAFPAILYLLCTGIFLFFNTSNKFRFAIQSAIGGIAGLSLSAFFWLPSLIEKKFTLTDDILLTELARYDIHFVDPHQFWYSPWGYGGSTIGTTDGFSFQLGKIYIGLVILSIIISIIYLLIKRKFTIQIKMYYFFLLMLLDSLFMTTSWSKPVWDSFQFLHYLQFPWRFLSFVNFYSALCAGFGIYFIHELLPKKNISVYIMYGISGTILAMALLVQSKYFSPQKFIEPKVSDLTSIQEISWRVSRSSFEFIPSGVSTTRSDLNTTIPAITEDMIPYAPYMIINGTAEVAIIKNTFSHKVFKIRSELPVTFQLNTFNFPGWQAEINNTSTEINDNNDLKLIQITIPKGSHIVTFIFGHTPIRIVAELISVIAFSAIVSVGVSLLFRRKKLV